MDCREVREGYQSLKAGPTTKNDNTLKIVRSQKASRSQIRKHDLHILIISQIAMCSFQTRLSFLQECEQEANLPPTSGPDEFSSSAAFTKLYTSTQITTQTCSIAPTTERLHQRMALNSANRSLQSRATTPWPAGTRQMKKDYLHKITNPLLVW